MALPPWVLQLGSLALGVGALCVLVADDADHSWALSQGTSALLGGLIGGLAAWHVQPPKKDQPA